MNLLVKEEQVIYIYKNKQNKQNKQNKPTSVRNIILNVNTNTSYVRMPKHWHAYSKIWICNQYVLRPYHHMMVVESYKAASIIPTVAILHSGMFHNGVYPIMGVGRDIMLLAQMFYDSNETVLYSFIKWRRGHGLTTNMTYTTSGQSGYILEMGSDNTLYILDLYHKCDIGFIKEFLEHRGELKSYNFYIAVVDTIINNGDGDIVTITMLDD
jgi:hypothetical protein